MFLLEGKTAVVTGAGSGIGRAIALGMAQAGAAVLAADIMAEGLSETVSAINNGGARRAAWRRTCVRRPVSTA